MLFGVDNGLSLEKLMHKLSYQYRDFFLALESKVISATSTSAHVPLLSLVPAVIY